MRKIAVLSQKGGAGKTTLAIHLAVAASGSGERVVLIDTDPQQSASVWGRSRSKPDPVVATVAAPDLGRVFEAAKSEGMTLALIDTAPHAAPSASQIAGSADLALLPVRPSVLDVAAAAAMVRIIQAAKVPASFVLSACPPRAYEIQEAREALAVYGFPVAPVEIIERRSYARAIAAGAGVTEYEDPRAAAETQDLWSWLIKEVL
ncbi:AAA family ATPase [Candidatus Igneacidithiobacillus taiwanensis]|uniref:nucleotide-binding protein n=1 Tax=Candidatus Igneacidithiobacillus taiwanensis TaxID=1945924 RepID=UPI00289B8417|nr:AAA family ATPase [Candidatus Igneacidithiobacillus taiwanensis]